MDRRTIASRIARIGAHCPERLGALVCVAGGCALVVAVTGCAGALGSSVSLASVSLGRPIPLPAAAGATYTLMQMNLCLSGFAACYGKVAYPAGVNEAVVRIRDAHPDAVTVNEGCRGDVAQIARLTGYHLRFSTVTSFGEPLRCIRPGGRGRFGDAVLTRAAIATTDTDDFEAQAGVESRRWLCVDTRAGVAVCTAHLATRSAGESAGNDAQCAELATLLERRAETRTVIFGATPIAAEPALPSAPGPGRTGRPARPRDCSACMEAAR